MKKIYFLPALCAVGLLGGTTLSQPVWAAEPNGAAEAQAHQEASHQHRSVLTLSDAIEKALAASPRLKSAAAQLEAAKGAEDQAGAWPNPEFEFEAEDIAGSGNLSGVNGAEITYGIAQELEIGGKVSSRSEAAKQGVMLGQYGQTMERYNLIRDVEIAYYNAVAAQEMLALSEERKTLAETLLAAVKKRVNAALEPEVQLRKAEITVSTAKVAHQRAQREFHHTKHVLASLWTGHDEAFLLEADPLYRLTTPPTEKEVEAKLLQTPDIKQWEVKRNQQEALYELEKAKAIPNPRLRFGVRDLRETGDQAFMAGLSIPIPVFNANTGNITSAKSNLSRSQSDGDATHIDLRNTLYHRLEEMVNSYHQANTLTADIIPSAEDAFALSRKGYNSGSFPYLEVLDAQRTLFEAKEQYIKTLEEYHTARANVERLTTITEEQE